MQQNPGKYRLDNKTMGIWDEAARTSGGVGPDYDYSMLGVTDNRGHGSDLGKLPNHPTFSNQSAYSTAGLGQKYEGGSWDGNTFTPSKRMLGNHNIEQLQWMLDNGYNDGDNYYNPVLGKMLTRSKR